MKTEDLHGFDSDRPIHRIEDDLLGRADFANDLAMAIHNWRGKDSLVVALHGEWGSGKSSVKNMAVSLLKGQKDYQPNIVEFSPWQWAAQDQITSSFFKEISISIGRSDKSKSSKKLAATFKKYGRYLNTGELVVSGLSSALPFMFVMAIFLGLSASSFDQTWIKNTSFIALIILAICAAILKWGTNLLNNLSSIFDNYAQENMLSLEDYKQELTALLSKRENTLIVIMDDLDRLTTDQLRMVFQLIKANLEFPNVVFLLLFQRDLVEEKLTDGKQTGRDYLEKIIQVPFDIPKIEQSKLHQLLFNKLDQLLERDQSASEMFDQNYWANAFNRGGLSRYFDNLRNVYRFVSTLSFHFSLLKGKSHFEVNPVDLIAIECLRMFEPDVHHEIAKSKDVLVNGLDQFHRDEDTIKQRLDDIIKKSNSGYENNVKELIKILFPTIERYLGGMHYSYQNSDGWLKEMRICHQSNFDKYFQFSIPSTELSNSELQQVLTLTSNSEKLSEFLLSLQERGILLNSLIQFEAYTDDIQRSNGYEFIKGLLDIGDQVDHEMVGFSLFSSNLMICRLVVQYLRSMDDLEQRGQLLLKCYKNSSGISIVEQLVQSDENRRKKSESDLVFADKEFEELKIEFVNKLDHLAYHESDKLIKHPHLGSLLYRWKKWGDENKVQKWINDQTNTIEGSIAILKAFVTKSSSQTVHQYIPTITKVIKLKNISNFADPQKISSKLDQLELQSLDEESKDAVLAFRTALEKEKTNADEAL